MSLFSQSTIERAAKIMMIIAGAMILLASFTVREFATDGPGHARWLAAFADLMSRGDIYPRWLPEPYGGLGSAAFYFYPPLTYWIGAPIWMAFSGLDPIHRFAIIAILGSVLSYFTCKYALSEIFPNSETTWAALLYVVAPYHVFDLFYRFGISSHYSFIFLPLLGAALVIQGEQKRMRLAAFGFGGLLLTNVPALMIGVVLSAVYLLVEWIRRRRVTYGIMVGGIIAAVLTAFFWLPIPFVQEYIQPSQLARDNQFLLDAVGAVDSLLRKFLLTESTVTLVMYITSIVLLFIGWRYKIVAGSAAPVRAFILVASAIVFFLGNQWLSGFLWYDNRFNTLLQFPYRWSALVVMAICVAYAAPMLRYRKLIVLTVFAWVFISVGLSSLTAFELRVNPRAEERTPYDPPEYAPKYAVADMHANIAVARAHERDPQIAALRPLAESERLAETRHDPRLLEYKVDLQQPASVRFQQWYWPFWKLTKAGAEVSTAPDSEGLTIAELPAGSYLLTFELIETSWEKLGRWISITGGFGVLLIWGIRRRTGSKPH